MLLSATVTGETEAVMQIPDTPHRAAWPAICTPCDFFVKTGRENDWFT